MKKNKTVYVLGAGFSISAGAPPQAKLISEIFRLNDDNPNYFEPGTVEKFRNLLTKTMNLPSFMHHEIPLEDVFTPLDRCLMDDMSYRNLTIEDIVKARSNINYLLGRTLDILLGHTSRNYIDDFAEYVVKKAKVRSELKYREDDPISIISLNWDILMDNSLKKALPELISPKIAVVDYCCYISSFDEDDESIKPGLEALGKGGFNVKLLKLHGSLNWLSCPRCKCLYIGFYEKIGLREFYKNQKCRHCFENFPESKSFLVSNLIMPTFLKNLSSPQLKLIWQNAGVELSEASRIVFIGYSLPQADFELRQLLSRMVRKDALIEVVSNSNECFKRYRTFFGARNIKFHEGGAESFLKNEIAEED